MTILHIIESSGGSADFVLYLNKYLPEHHHQVVYSDRTFANRFEQIKAAYPNASFYCWKDIQREVRLIKDIKASFNLYRILKNLPSDAIHLHSSKAGFLGRLVCFIQRRKNVIYTPNGLAFLRRDVSSFKNLIYVWLEKFADILNGRVISCSKSEADALISKGIPSTYINNGTEIFDEEVSLANAGNRQMVIVTSGRITIQKNPSQFQAIASHFENDRNYRFIWIGSGELEHLLTSKNITVTGWLDRQMVLTKVLSSDLYISTALWEGLPFAVLEAMNLSKPLLLSNCVGKNDLVKNDLNGFLFTTPIDAVERIKTLYNDRQMLMAFGRASKALVINQFDVIEMAKTYEIAYSQHV